MKLVIEWILPVKTISEANSSEHWTKKRKRHQGQKKWVNFVFMKDKPSIPQRCHVNLVRISPRFLDTGDNLPMAFKWIKDYVAANLRPGKAAGHADNDELISWGYDQEKGKPQQIKIQIFDPSCD
jgi:hypothetical protein